MSTLFGAIADDFTGATDLASLLARSGVPVSLRIGVPRNDPTETAALEIIALKCRAAPPEEAVEEARDALAWLRRAGSKRFFWKYCSTFDSTPRGNIGPVAEAIMSDLGVSQTIYCPAFPENGRSIFMGHLFVGELPLAESPMKDHPLTPMRDSNLMRLLAPQVTRPVGLASRSMMARGPTKLRQRLSELRDAGIAHVIVDAVDNEDLRIVAQACQDMDFLTGSSALAEPLPLIWLKQGLLSRSDVTVAARRKKGPAVVLSGSCSAMTNRQVTSYVSRGSPAFQLDPLALAEDGPGAALRWLVEQDLELAPIVYASAEPASVLAVQARLGAKRAGLLVEDALAACAVAARDAGARHLIVAGGETSGAVAKALGIERLNIGPEISPGVPWCFARSGGHDLAIALKSGNFGRETFFVDALEALKT